MHRLRHPIRSITEPYGKAGLLVAILALVLATTGAALAAGGLTKPQEKQVIKIAKKYAGKPGAIGAQGPAGPQGNPGAAGAPGAPGKDGTSATTATIPTTSPQCAHLGGVEVKSASPTTEVCNGQTGFTSTLPEGKTEMGAWTLTVPAEEPTFHKPFPRSPISFVIPLETAPNSIFLKASEIEPLREGKFGAASEELCEGKTDGALESCKERYELIAVECPGTAAEPKAAKGVLCVYSETELDAPGQFIVTASSFGAVIGSSISEPGSTGGLALGSWAVTAE